MARYFAILLIIKMASIISALTIENKILENPQVECQTDAVVVSFSTDKPFQGRVFVQGHYGNEDCRRDFSGSPNAHGQMKVQFDKCGMRRKRSIEPKGMAISSTVVVSFHPTFITSVDRAYKIQCFYKEGQEIVTNGIDVSNIPTTDLSFLVAMPKCTYQVLSGGPEGSVVQYAKVGDKVFHKWSCNFEMPELYCMTIHSCTVDDGAGVPYYMIDEEGCAKDPVILDDLTYITDLMAGTESSVFKFADKAHVYFTCKIRLSLKHDHEQEGGNCPRPKCNVTRRFRFRRDLPDPNLNTSLVEEKASNETSLLVDILAAHNGTNSTDGVDGKSRQRRSSANDFDLFAAPVMVLDLVDTDPQTDSQTGTPYPAIDLPGQPVGPSWLPFHRNRRDVGICMSETSFGFLIGVALLAGISSIVLTTAACLIRTKKH